MNTSNGPRAWRRSKGQSGDFSKLTYPFGHGRTANTISKGKGGGGESSDSVKGFANDIIVHTLDYNVEFDDGGSELSEGRFKRARDRA
ncbi:hypothetical protein AJ79_10034 [Helicocarpus griseus UAMH5409]|uniref:Uncharacterized protein n=1 Tax=Helicocarpus griseus UAMH5409 TaxID=1447875 RepID=A0A2B7WFX3_9EURO|nr:hypothetical protein AJ79_10034 [Helicocarpus griseus UAMH5409]